MKKAILLTILAAAAALPGRAAPASTESLDKLIQLERLSRIHDTILGSIDRGTTMSLRQALHGQPPTAADEAVFVSLHSQVVAAVDEALNEAKLKLVYEKIYGEVYSQEEVDGLIAFYSTPIGQVFAEKQPEIAQKTNARMQQQMMPMIMKIRAEAEAASRKLMAAHAPTPPRAVTAPSAQPQPKP